MIVQEGVVTCMDCLEGLKGVRSKAAREGVRGVTYEDWFIRKKIDEELSGVEMQVISKLK